MLILSRKPQQSIVIGDDIVISIVDIGRGRVQIGITAPAYVPVYRQEIIERMQASGELEAAGCASPAN